MSSNSESKTQNQKPAESQNLKTVSQEVISEEKLPTWRSKIKEFLTSWKFKGAVSFILIFFFAYIIFFWQHIMAVTSLRMWSSHANAVSIDCMMKDTNGDEYISCTAKLDQQVVPLECGVSLFNLGCRVNYGSASPSIRATKNN